MLVNNLKVNNQRKNIRSKFRSNTNTNIGQYYFWQNVEQICNVNIKKTTKVEAFIFLSFYLWS